MEPATKSYVDAACKKHDLCYERKGYFNCECDMELMGEISSLEALIRKNRATPNQWLYGQESLASAATQMYYSLPLCTGSQFAVKALIAPFMVYSTAAGIVGGVAATIISLPLKALWYALCPFSERGCKGGPGSP